MLGRVKFAPRLHLDFMDGKFTPHKGINLIEGHWPQDTIIDLHLMFETPETQLETVISRSPNLVIFHAESQGKIINLMQQLQALNIKCGVALLQQTSPDVAADLIKQADHILIFTGKLGSYGGQFQSEQLAKIAKARAVNPKIEVAIDGGINSTNVHQIIAAGADVLNVGGAIQKADDPQQAYKELVEIVQEIGR